MKNRPRLVIVLVLAAFVIAAYAFAASQAGPQPIKLVPSGSQTIGPTAVATTIATNTTATFPADPGNTAVYCNGALDIHWGASCPTATPSVQICVGGNCDPRGIDPASCTANGQSFVPVNLRLDFNVPTNHPWWPTSSVLALQVTGADQQFVVFQSGTNVGTAVSCYVTPSSQG